MRLLSSKTRQFALADLGMKEKDLSLVKEAIKKPFGMLLSTGPTGSGKTTSIYAIVKLLNSRDVNIATIEDPVEYEISGINQIQVNPKTNLTFASGLRSILRQDPNVIFVGEIRDEETASIAINSATTGHLVLSTLHTNDAATALPRLLDMKIEPYLVASTVNAIIGQRLVRKICEKCRVSEEISREEIDKSIPQFVSKRHFGTQEKIRVYKGKGCPVCHNTGFHERIGIFEVLVVSPEIRELINKKASADALKEMAVKLGMTTMLDDGIDKVIQGLTTLEEILRATKE
jgi:type II secretory ATPase GspE/PulE/Tfp pilus assembly ATPase PilB-like protein